MGTVQEGNKYVHALLITLADCKLRAMGLAGGREGTDRVDHLPLTTKERAEYCWSQGSVLLSPWEGGKGEGGSRGSSQVQSVIIISH